MDIETYPDYQLLAPSAKILIAPDQSAELDTQILFGESMKVLEYHDDQWMRVRANHDGKEGWIHFFEAAWVPVEHAEKPTHRVSEAAAYVYREPHFKSAPVTCLSMNSLITAGDTMVSHGGEGEYTHIVGLLGEPRAWIPSDQIRPIDEFADDHVEEALKFLNTRYLWGFRDASNAVDCSSMMQHVSNACGRKSPRDSKPQSESLGIEIDFRNGKLDSVFQRGDFVFWMSEKGRHVVIMIDDSRCIHGTIAPPHRRIVVQHLTQVMYEQRRDGNGDITGVRRFEDYKYSKLGSLVA